jgi:sulfur relay (sulfurtransferase) DsrC/TusE family protein
MQQILENLTRINNIYSLIAFIILSILVIFLIITGIFLLIKKIGKVSFKKGDFEFDIEPKTPITPSVVESIRVEEKPCVTQSLADHPFFADLLKWEKRDIPALKIKSLIKKTIVVEFLKLLFRNFRQKFRNYVINTEMLINQSQQIKCDELIQFFLDYIDQYNIEAKKIEIKYKNRIINGIPDIFLQKFDNWHNPHIEIINESIKQIVNNEIYPDEKMKLLAIVEIFYVAFKLTIQDAINTINELNGEIEKEFERLSNG